MSKPKLERVMPNNADAEAFVLRCMMMSEESAVTIPKVLKTLTALDFYKKVNQILFSAIEFLFTAGTPVDVITLSNYVEQKKLMDSYEFPDLFEEVDSVWSTVNVEHYAKIVKEHATRRAMIRLGAKIHQSGFDETVDLTELIESCEKSMLSLRSGNTNNIAPISSTLKETFQHIQAAYDNSERTIGLPTGFLDLDEKTSGYLDGDFIVIAGRPSMGKSTFIQNTIHYLAINEKIPVLLFSAEMSKMAVTMRILASDAGVDLHNLRRGRLKNSEWPLITMAASRISEAPIILDDTASIKIGELRAKAHQAVSEHGVKLIVVDYLQLVKGTSKFGKREETGEVSAALKGIGRDLNVPLVAVSQLNRQAEARPDKRPQLSDLRESGDIEQDADVVILLYRDAYYNKQSIDNTTEVIIAKQRNGPTGVVRVLFDASKMRFLDLAKGQQMEF